MRRLSFIVLVLGILILIFLGFKKIEISSREDLEKLEANSKIVIEGIVSKEVRYQKNKILLFDNGIELTCDCPSNLLKKKIRAEGFIEEFNEKKRIRVLKIELIGD